MAVKDELKRIIDNSYVLAKLPLVTPTFGDRWKERLEDHTIESLSDIAWVQGRRAIVLEKHIKRFLDRGETIESPDQPEFKYELNAMVTHITNEYNEKAMVIVARCFEESKGGRDEIYTVSYQEMGSMIRVRLHVEELRQI